MRLVPLWTLFLASLCAGKEALPSGRLSAGGADTQQAGGLDRKADEGVVLHHVDMSVSARRLVDVSAMLKKNGVDRVDLSNNGLLRMPAFPPHTIVKKLDMQDNKLSALSAGMFRNLGQLRSLNLSHNQITSLPHHVFTHLRLLQTLDLSRNMLTKLNVKVFHGLLSLRQLDIRNNPFNTPKANSRSPYAELIQLISSSKGMWKTREGRCALVQYVRYHPRLDVPTDASLFSTVTSAIDRVCNASRSAKPIPKLGGASAAMSGAKEDVQSSSPSAESDDDLSTSSSSDSENDQRTSSSSDSENEQSTSSSSDSEDEQSTFSSSDSEDDESTSSSSDSEDDQRTSSSSDSEDDQSTSSSSDSKYDQSTSSSSDSEYDQSTSSSSDSEYDQRTSSSSDSEYDQSTSSSSDSEDEQSTSSSSDSGNGLIGSSTDDQQMEMSFLDDIIDKVKPLASADDGTSQVRNAELDGVVDTVPPFVFPDITSEQSSPEAQRNDLLRLIHLLVPIGPKKTTEPRVSEEDRLLLRQLIDQLVPFLRRVSNKTDMGAPAPVNVAAARRTGVQLPKRMSIMTMALIVVFSALMGIALICTVLAIMKYRSNRPWNKSGGLPQGMSAVRKVVSLKRKNSHIFERQVDDDLGDWE